MIHKRLKGGLLMLLLVLLGGFSVEASLQLPRVLSSNMVFQRHMPVAIWGMADPGQRILITFGTQQHSAVAGTQGRWQVLLTPMDASFVPRDLYISTNDADTVLTNILVGEVWLCGGQSNMEYPMDRRLKKYAAPGRGVDVAEVEWRQGGLSAVRLLRIEKVNSLPDCTTQGWTVCVDSTLAPFSAVGYFFGKALQETLDVPIGLISSNWGGSRIERWTPSSAYEQSPVFAEEATAKPVRIDNIDPGLHFNSMIAPLAPYTLRGFIWYQGESNVMFHDARYVEKTRLMLDAWRTAFNRRDAPFYFVQVAPYAYTRRKDKMPHTPQTMAEFCAQQTACLALPHTGQVIVTDLVDNLADIHPSYKWEVGRRLALWALAKTYRQDNRVFSGPKVVALSVKRSLATLRFEHLGGGLTAGRHNPETNAFEPVSEALTWFEVAGKDGVFHQATAVINGDEVVVSSPAVKQPVSVRFAWNEAAMPNLFNREGLPAVPGQWSRAK